MGNHAKWRKPDDRLPARDTDRILMNRTPTRLHITGRDGASLILAPFERCQVPASKLRPFALVPLVNAGVVDNQPCKQVGPPAGPALLALGGVSALVAASLMAGSLLLSGVVLLLALMAGGWVLARRSPPVLASSASGLLGRFGRFCIDTSLRVGDQISLLLVIVIGIGLPGLAVANAFYTKMTASGPSPAAFLAGPDGRRLLIGYGLQWLFVTTLSIMPAVLYFLFDRERLAALSGRFVRHAFRLDPSLSTVRDLEAKYGGQMFEVFGAWNQNRRTNRMPQGRRAPLLLATLLVTVGWMAAVLNPHLRPISPAGRAAQDSGLLALLVPAKSVFVFAFLGAYFFTIQAVLRGYVRRDLRPKTYSTISVRFVIVTILAWVITVSAPASNHGLWVLAFFTGAVPDTGIRYLREFLVSRNSVRQVVPSLYERAPLTDLEGIDVFDRSRLEDEGVTNIEALAHSDLVELMLQTRIPAARLIDWVDQAILYLHLGLYDEVDRKGPAHELRSRLRLHGVRTATDLFQVRQAAGKRGENGLNDLCQALAGLAGGAEAGLLRMEVIADGLAHEEWLESIRHWRACGRLSDRTREEHCPAPENLKAADDLPMALVTAAPQSPPGATAAAV